MTLNDRPLFTFGTLMDADVLHLVCGIPPNELTLNAAVVSGFERRMVRGESFPVLVPQTEGKVSGLLIEGLSDTAVERAAFFEGDEYSLQPIEAEGLPDSHSSGISGSRQAAFFADNQVYEVSNFDWSLSDWQAREKNEFMQRVKHYMSLFGTMSATEADKHW